MVLLSLRSVFVGGANALMIGYLPYHFPYFFTRSPGVIGQIRALTPFLSRGLLVHALTMAFEGTLLAERDLNYLAGCYTINVVLTLSFLLYVVRGGGVGIAGVWTGVLGFQVSASLLQGRPASRYSRPVDSIEGLGRVCLTRRSRLWG
jgi:Na+-driven multidrug efflux pump